MKDVHAFLNNILCKVEDDKVLSRSECIQILNLDNIHILSLVDKAYSIKRKFFGNKFHVQVLNNIKSGYCSEDCHYCSQSKVSTADIKKYPILKEEEIIQGAKDTEKQNAKRYCVALSGIRHSDKDVQTMCRAIQVIKKECQLEVCCSIGFLTDMQFKMLKSAGLDVINHNINTSRNFHPEVCTTHSFDQRINNLNLAKKNGLKLCCGGILGQGESQDDVIDFMLALKEVNPDSVPLNFLIPVKGTPFEDRAKDVTPQFCLKVLCLARFLLPDKEIRIAGGREVHLRSLQSLSLYVVNSCFVSGYLTTTGQDADSTIQMIRDCGFELVIQHKI